MNSREILHFVSHLQDPKMKPKIRHSYFDLVKGQWEEKGGKYVI